MPSYPRLPAMFRCLLPLAVVLALAGSCITVKVPLGEEPGPLKEKVLSGYGQDKILLIDISGFLLEKAPSSWLGLFHKISLPARLKEELDKAHQDPHIKALVLRIHSPGGTVTAADLIHHELERFKASRRLPTLAFVMGLAASGGYYVAQAADTIVAQPTSIIGSIGVLALKLNLKELLEKLGVGTELVKTGKMKDLWSPFRPASPEEARVMQAIIDDFQERFLTVVATSRHLSRPELLAVADGRIFTASQALNLKLIDQIGYLDDTLTLAQKQAGLDTAKIITYHRPDSYRGSIYAQGPGGLLGAALPPTLTSPDLPNAQNPEFFYLWQP